MPMNSIIGTHVTPRYTDHFSVSGIIGLRYFDIDEKIKMYFTKPFDEIPQTSRYRIRDRKHLTFGLQLGGDIECNPYQFLTWGLVVKGGGLFNRDRQRTLMLDKGNTIVHRNIDKSGFNFAYFAQVFPFIELRPHQALSSFFSTIKSSTSEPLQPLAAT